MSSFARKSSSNIGAASLNPLMMTSSAVALIADAGSGLAKGAREAASLVMEGEDEDEDDRFDGKELKGDPLQANAEELENQQDTMMASHVKDMLVIYERRNEDDTKEAEDEARVHSAFQRKCRKLLKAGRFDAFFSALIVVDSILIAAAVDMEKENSLIIVLQAIFTLAFLVELLVRVAAEPWRVTDVLLLFDAFLVSISVLEVASRVVGAPINILFLRGLRVFRLMRVVKMTKTADKKLPPLQLLINAIGRSVQPLVIVLLLSGILVFAFAVMLTNMVPEALQDGEEVRQVVLQQYGTVSKSARSFLEVIDGSGSCSIDSMLILYTAATQGRSGSALIIISRLLASFVLFLALSGLVTGVFIEQLCGATARIEERAHQQELLKSHECLSMLDQVFASMGYSCDDPITWREIERGLESNLSVQERLDISLEDARRLFLHLDDDGDGSVGTDEFIFGVFKLKTISKSLDMLSIDYQQEKALQRLSDLHSTLRLSIAGIQSRLAAFAGLLPDIEKNINAVTAGIDEVQKLEEDLVVAHKSRLEAKNAGHARESVSNVVNLETLRSNYHLNSQLTALEEEFHRLQQSEERGEPTALERQEAINTVADGIVASVRQMLEEELAAFKK